MNFRKPGVGHRAFQVSGLLELVVQRAMSMAVIPRQPSDSFPAVQPMAPGEDFVRLFTQNQRALYLFIVPLVGSPADAEEVLQETNVVIWSKWDQFQAGTNFLAWGRAIARLEVFRFRRRKDRRQQPLGDEVLEIVADELQQQPNDFDRRREALTACISKLREKDRQLIQHRYSEGQSGDDVANQLGRPANSVYQSLGRIRRVLMECVRRQMASAGGVQ
jgi:RNA polymerase sigma-70 factor (ECF subfamily)